MGEIADMMVNGLMCQECGAWMEDHEEPGYPRTCRSCEADVSSELQKLQARVNCPHCSKRVAAIGLQQHIDAKHTQGEEV